MAENTNIKNTEQNNVNKSPHALREEKILSFWKENNTFKKSLAKDFPKGDFTFYDGPPFATGLPHYGHILPGTIKDVMPRYKTMQGYRVRRRWGWDCHGLPVENLIEKELGLKTKKDIIDYGIGKFNAVAKQSVMRFADEWRTIVPRLGRWVDMEDDYRTMDASYTETVWWIFKKLNDKGLIYEGFKSMNLCPRCETTLSNFEVAQGYKDITDISVTAKFKVRSGQKMGSIPLGNDTYILAWTTTPWTLPGNVALAVGPDIEYVRVKVESVFYILAKSRMAVLKDIKYEIVETIQGSDLAGLQYEPLFDYYAKNSSLKNVTNGWKVYVADFVTTEDGTGIVHIAPAFGSDDYNLLVANQLPFVQHVTTSGHFKPEVTNFAGLSVKPKSSDTDKDAHQKTDIEIIKWLAHHGQLFAKEKLIHSYPHCWRCETPLLNYATSSWFVRVTDLKDKLIKANKKVDWVPSEIGEGRFGNWLQGARDWAISRTRFWGAPIPVWKEVSSNNGIGQSSTNAYHVVGSLSDLKKYSKPKNKFFVMRHGQAENNVKNILSARSDNPHHLTDNGKSQVLAGAQSFRKSFGNNKIDLIFVSPFVRTQETAKIAAKELGVESRNIITDIRLSEWNTGVWNNKPLADFQKEFAHGIIRFTKTPEKGENYSDIRKRVGEFIYEIESKYEGKNILFVTHESPAFLLLSVARGADTREAAEMDIYGGGDFIKNGQIMNADFVPLPHNENFELDLHRPFIDDIKLETENGTKLVRVPDVFDCWFESGSMPYGEAHYPFCNLDSTCKTQESFQPKSGLFKKSKGFPADFISEGLDQTRGWFYSMMVLGVALFGKSPFNKVVVNGLVLAEDGQKMSKSKKNYPDPMLIVDKFGADALRYYLMSSPAVHAQDLCFSEKGVDEVTKKVVNRLLNVVTFYEMFAGDEQSGSKNVLDRWIISRLNEVISAVTDGLEKGEIDRAVRPFNDFVDDLSTWYLRRSRERFKGDDLIDKKNALYTTRYVLHVIARLMAPFTPFLSEEIYQRIMISQFKSDGQESVHLENWPISGSIENDISENMNEVRKIASLGLEARTVAKINVRQPLQKLQVKNIKFDIESNDQLVQLIKDEVNVKDIVINPNIENEVELDLNLTDELKSEGEFRELLRKVQDMRKEKGLSVGDQAVLIVSPDLSNIVTVYGDDIKKLANISSIEKGDVLSLKL